MRKIAFQKILWMVFLLFILILLLVQILISSIQMHKGYLPIQLLKQILNSSKHKYNHLHWYRILNLLWKWLCFHLNLLLNLYLKLLNSRLLRTINNLYLKKTLKIQILKKVKQVMYLQLQHQLQIVMYLAQITPEHHPSAKKLHLTQ